MTSFAAKIINNPKEILKSPRIILDAKLEDIIKFGKEYPDIFGKVLMKVPGVLEKFPENQRKTIHDGFVKGFNKIFKEDPTLVTLFPKNQQAEIMKMHPSVWSPKDTMKLAGSLFLTERLDKVASQLEKKGYIKEAYEIDTISNELESFGVD